MISVGATGSLVTGDILDVNRNALERKLRDYDSQLYLKWNPKKLRGYGLWEVRRRPNLPTAHPISVFKGTTIYKLDYIENDIINHVMDLPYLNYSALTKLEKMDTWKDKNWVQNAEYKGAKYREDAEKKKLKELAYNFKQQKQEIRDYRQWISEGNNPALLAHFWGQNANKR